MPLCRPPSTPDALAKTKTAPSRERTSSDASRPSLFRCRVLSTSTTAAGLRIREGIHDGFRVSSAYAPVERDVSLSHDEPEDLAYRITVPDHGFANRVHEIICTSAFAMLEAHHAALNFPSLRVEFLGLVLQETVSRTDASIVHIMLTLMNRGTTDPL